MSRSRISEQRLMAYFDGEMSEAEAREIEQALEDDPASRALLDEWARQNAALAALYEAEGEAPIPTRHADLIEASRAETARRATPTLIRIAAMLALVALGAAGGWFGALMTTSRTPLTADLAQSAILAHATFVSEVVHPVEVDAAQEAHLVQWVSKRMDHPINPPDFARLGFRLMGGRIIPGETGPAALFMYTNDEGRRITLYVASPQTPRETAFQFARGNGFDAFYWIDGALSYAVVGDVGRDLLRAVAVDAYEQLA